jgi:hypothetical protein
VYVRRAVLTRRNLLARAAATGLTATVASALPVARRLESALAADLGPMDPDGTLQAFADTIIPGRKVETTELGNPVSAGAIAGVDNLPGAVETDALALYHHPLVGFDALEPAFLADLEGRAAQHGGDFLSLGFDARTQVCIEGLAYDSPERLLWEAAAAVPFTAFCAAALVPEATAAKAAGYRVMGLPGVAPAGYRRGFSYGRRLSRERTKHGYLP